MKKFQEGGMAPEAAPAPEQQQDPIMMLVEASMMALQEGNCEAAMAVCEGLVQLVQQASGGQPPMGAPAEGQPVFKRGGKIARREKK